MLIVSRSTDGSNSHLDIQPQRAKHPLGLFGDFRAYAVAGKHRNVICHSLS
jgi:hypothetical protein